MPARGGSSHAACRSRGRGTTPRPEPPTAPGSSPRTPPALLAAPPPGSSLATLSATGREAHQARRTEGHSAPPTTDLSSSLPTARCCCFPDPLRARRRVLEQSPPCREWPKPPEAWRVHLRGALRPQLRTRRFWQGPQRQPLRRPLRLLWPSPPRQLSLLLQPSLQLSPWRPSLQRPSLWRPSPPLPSSQLPRLPPCVRPSRQWPWPRRPLAQQPPGPLTSQKHRFSKGRRRRMRQQRSRHPLPRLQFPPIFSPGPWLASPSPARAGCLRGESTAMAVCRYNAHVRAVQGARPA
mmetsp:Transcript_79302/g.201859  ORF Transcript_79302/g.201859 Transcript_79302/m.201859 type:complete len:294 (+) Transcript_79302:1200-2081(+)